MRTAKARRDVLLISAGDPPDGGCTWISTLRTGRPASGVVAGVGRAIPGVIEKIVDERMRIRSRARRRQTDHDHRARNGETNSRSDDKFGRVAGRADECERQL